MIPATPANQKESSISSLHAAGGASQHDTIQKPPKRREPFHCNTTSLEFRVQDNGR